MDLMATVPETIALQFNQAGVKDAPRYCAIADLTLGQRYGQTWLIVTDRHVAACDSAGALVALERAHIKEVEVDELFGGGRLLAHTSDGQRTLVYYTKACVPEFAAMRRVINDLAIGVSPEVPEDEEHAHCPKCGAPLPERGARCPICIPRWAVFRRLLGLAKPYRTKLHLLILATFVTVGTVMAPPLATKMIADEVIRDGRLSRLALWIGLMVASGLVLLCSRVATGVLSSWLGARVVADLRHGLHARLQRLQMRYFNKQDSGELISRVMQDTRELQHFLIDGMPFLVVNVVMFLAIAAVFLYLDVRLALLVFLPVPLLVGGGSWFWSKLIPMFHKHGTRRARLHTILGESIRGVKSVKALAQEARRSAEFGSANELLFSVRFNIEKTFIGFFELMLWVMSVGTAAVWFFAALRIARHDPSLSLGDLIAFVGFIALFYGPLQWFTVVVNWMTHAFTSAERIFAVLDSPPEVYEASDAVDLPEIRGAISFKDVRFSYERGKEVIKGISFDVAPGEMVGLVGKSGAGKSTLINLICRFYDVDSGVISIDGHPIKRLKLSPLRQQIGIVMQEPFLFNGTILENIRYGSPSAAFNEAVRAAKAAHAHEFIVDKEDGYDTVIGESGASLSGGEKQRIAIARAILHNPPILILDEATSSVDSETEKAIQEAIANLIRDRTTVAIAHRLATLRNANRLIVVDDGLIAEIGTHDELVAKGGMYAKLVSLQSELSKLKARVWQE